MALELGATREALLEAGASADKASKAAQELAGYETRLGGLDMKLERLDGRVNLLAWMVGTNIALSVAILLRLFTH